MFAPWCPTCRTRVLLGAESIVRFAWDGAPVDGPASIEKDAS